MKTTSLSQILLLLSLTVANTHFLSAQDCLNLLFNGDFGNKDGFASDYSLANNILTPGQYTLTNDASKLSAFYMPIVDHTAGSGTNYMAIDGDMNNTKSFWRSTVSVVAGKTYAFSFWIANIHTVFSKANPDTTMAQPAKFEFVIDGIALRKINTLPDNQWRQYTQVYTATATKTMEIALRNNANPFPTAGNDFALDDIGFEESCVVTSNEITFENKEAFRVYPNPVRSGTLYFGKTASSFSLVSADNTVLRTGTDASSLSTEGLAKGICLLRLEDKVYKVLIE